METERIQERDDGPDLIGTLIVCVLSVAIPLFGLAIGGALRLAGNGDVKRVGSICIGIAAVTWLVKWLL